MIRAATLVANLNFWSKRKELAIENMEKKIDEIVKKTRQRTWTKLVVPNGNLNEAF